MALDETYSQYYNEIRRVTRYRCTKMGKKTCYKNSIYFKLLVHFKEYNLY
jgi:hypothetical protein